MEKIKLEQLFFSTSDQAWTYMRACDDAEKWAGWPEYDSVRKCFYIIVKKS